MSGWSRNDFLKNPSASQNQFLNIEKSHAGGARLDLFEIAFSDQNGFAMLLFQFFQGYIFEDWTASGFSPSLNRTWIKILPDSALCQANGGSAGAFRFESNASLKIQCNLYVGPPYLCGWLFLSGGNSVDAFTIL